LAVNGSADVNVEGHAGLLGIALKNMVRNALRYTPKGSEVELEVTESPVGFRVLDSGPGVPDALKETLFERFNRGKAAQDVDGSGIGLAIVQSVARAHGACATVSDRPGGGSIFAVTWPDRVGI
jgi:signal transduction histidine kinase